MHGGTIISAETLDVRLLRLGRMTHRVLTRDEVLAAGASPAQIDRRLRNGRLHREGPGVYAVGAPIDTRPGRILAAVRALGPDAEASHLTAAELRAVRPPGHGAIHVTAPSTWTSPPPGVVAHRTRRTDPGSGVCAGIPCTGLARTLLDLAGTFGRGEAERAWRAADARRLIVVADVEQELGRGRRGARIIRDLLEVHQKSGTARTESELEDRAADLLRPPRLPRPEHNVPVTAAGRRYRADIVWRDVRVIVELDSWTWHGTPVQHADGARRTLDLQSEGWIVVPMTWRDVTVDADATVLRVRRLLHLRGG